MTHVDEQWATWVDVPDYPTSDSDAGASSGAEDGCPGSCSSDSSSPRQLIRSVAFSGKSQLASSLARRWPKRSSRDMVRKLSGSSVDDCSICKEEGQEGVLTDCMHGFHKPCLCGYARRGGKE
eukprot:TRINITY_DN14851_c0_g1_i2.p1 TRINITY_DN14851_c0_g1~~TRINITY_DN14851_c0_g1_i2.p1  ORF type:complete len:123 (+),score=23.70 TRINITY_DN14851_c0_g1_i2:40-408(+)